ncbi:Cysteine desulfurase [Mycoplasmopsis maculosa]|uniref:Cysteine desulfurase n=1 Tax=Mycoplasmopsis maculosa TaxID=114885 RepID=A0A449B4B8_9BACT|nr:aminotransferase class V-fold PLP-dependent enzyme [Mycoplasmopsis maculosa]VEU75453.1 Cysteine desulfurase [Mycoplasmopsis maculosa]
MKNIRELFNMADKITYLDSAALALKPNIAIEASNDFYLNHSVSTRTSDSPLGIKTVNIIKETRKKVANLIEAKSDEIIFTSGTTDSLNKAANMLKSLLKKDDVILLSAYNHSSNLKPWISIAEETGAKVLIEENLIDFINEKTKIIAYSQMTNNFTYNSNTDEIYEKANKYGALVVNDAAQAIIYEQVSLEKSHIVAFSCNKFYGPTGLGILAIQEKLLNELPPVVYGGGAVLGMNKDKTFVLKKGYELHEPGTLNLAGIFMFNKSLDFFNEIGGYNSVQKILDDLSLYAYNKLSKIKNVTIYTNPKDHIILINVKNINSQDVSHYLGQKNIYVRSGIFCAQYLKHIKKDSSYLRISLGIYNNYDDIDKLAYELENGGDFLVI